MLGSDRAIKKEKAMWDKMDWEGSGEGKAARCNSK